MTKEEIAENKQFLLLPQCFSLLVIGYPVNFRDFQFFDKICLKSSAAELSYEGKGYSHVSHKPILEGIEINMITIKLHMHYLVPIV